MLDTVEYIHLAIHASKKGDTHAAMNYLKEALIEEPGNAVARYLLAAEHAEIGLYEKAINGMEEALRLTPELEIAQFQLGLLYLQTNRLDDAYRNFESLGSHTQDISLKAFSQAYQLMAREDANQAMAYLKHGIASCTNENLKADMERVLASLVTRLEAPPEQEEITDEKKASSAFILGAYRNSFDQH